MPLRAVRRVIFVAMPLLAAYIVLTSVAGTVIRYSPVPFGDMWNGTLGFLVKVYGGDQSVWWAQHNEHRIVLARLIFYVDQELLGGLSVLPFFINLACAFAATAILGLSTRRLALAHQRNAAETLVVFCFATAMAFSWIQSENFVWAFQGSFFLAYVLPLAAFVLLACSPENARQHGFAAATLLGVLSAGTLANGVLVLPLMFVLAFFCKTSTTQRAVLGFLSVLIPALYFSSYQSHAGHDSMLAALSRDPLGLLRYTFIYLGAPVHHLAPKGAGGLLVAEISGLLMVLVFAKSMHSTLTQQQPDATTLALLAFIGYVMVSALATAGGRLSFGLGQAVAGRYTTPTLLAWACLAIVLWAPRSTMHSTRQIVFLLLMLVTAAALAIRQNDAFRTADEDHLARKMAGLALALGIRDDDRVLRVFPDVGYALSVSRSAIRAQLSIFGHEPLQNAARQMGRKQPVRPLPVCEGEVTGIEALPQDAQRARIKGWVKIDEDKSPTSFKLVSANNLRSGLALESTPTSPDLYHGQDGHRRVFFQGYILTSAAGSALDIVVEPDICRATTDTPPSALQQ